MEDSSRNPEAQAYATSIDYTLRELQKRVREHEAELEKRRSSQDEAILSPKAQAEVITTALEEVTNSEPFLPFPSSILPALLALRKTHQTIVQSREYLASQTAAVDSEKRQLEAAQADLKDQNLLTDAIRTHTTTLRDKLQSNQGRPADDRAREKLAEMKAKKNNYDKETSRLMKALMKFINNNLATMLEAEELGGPVVGDLMDVDSADLAAGFNAQGKLKRSKGGADADKRQRRIDDIWGQDQESGEPREHGASGDASSMAAAEMRQLTEDLLNQLVSAQGDNSASYMELGRESAAARFLVRSKVATFHPKDATRLRLVDFGRELDA